jgi:large subunit ribosomal protein L29
MKPNDLKEMTEEELKAKLAELSEERFRLRFRSASESIENPMRFRAIRRDIARIQTALQMRGA